MDKPAKSKGTKIMSYLPRAATFSIPSRPYSPSHDRRSDAAVKSQSKGFSGPIVSMIPAEARRRNLRTRGAGRYEEVVAQEPTSPTVTCIGQIKHKKAAAAAASRSKSKRAAVAAAETAASPLSHAKREKKLARVLRMIFGGKPRPERPPLRHPLAAAGASAEAAPKLGQMKRFASSREGLAGFDWRASAVQPLESPYNHFDAEDSEADEEEEFNIARHSGAAAGGAAWEGKKEVNLWKRRTMAQPMPLQII